MKFVVGLERPQLKVLVWRCSKEVLEKENVQRCLRKLFTKHTSDLGKESIFERDAMF